MAGIAEWARLQPDATAIVDRGRTVSFGELERRQRLLAGAFTEAGLRPRDRVAVHSSNRTELVEVTTTALRTGIVPVPINALVTRPEVAYVIEDSGARWLFTDRAADHHPQVEHTATYGDAYERLLYEAKPGSLSDFALGRPMHYTSGTTGSPKGVWVEPIGDAEAASLSEEFRSLWGLSADDVHLVCSPLSHSAPHRYVLRTLEAGGTVVLQRRFDPEETLAAIELFGVTSTFMVPTHLERIFSLGARILRRHDLSSLRLLAHAGAPIRHETKCKAIELFPPGSVWEFYGSTEGHATRISSDEWLRKPGSVGRPRAGAEILILDEEKHPLPSGEVGSVWVRDPAAERFEYWGDRDKTAAAWHEGAFTVGDLGHLDDDGYLYLVGRLHDTIITGGVNVYPQEVEQVLVSHPAVAEAAVYGAPHDEWGQEVRALVVPAFAQPIDAGMLLAWMRERLAGFKCPRHVEIVGELPRTATGKLRRGPNQNLDTLDRLEGERPNA